MSRTLVIFPICLRPLIVSVSFGFKIQHGFRSCNTPESFTIVATKLAKQTTGFMSLIAADTIRLICGVLMEEFYNLPIDMAFL